MSIRVVDRDAEVVMKMLMVPLLAMRMPLDRYTFHQPSTSGAQTGLPRAVLMQHEHFQHLISREEGTELQKAGLTSGLRSSIRCHV